MAEANKFEIEDRLRKRLRRTTLEFEGTLGVDTNGVLTEEGINKLLDALRLEDLEIGEKK